LNNLGRSFTQQGVIVCRRILNPARVTGPLSFVLLASVLSWAFSPPLFALDSDPLPAANSSERELSRLIEISSQLTQLNEKLRNELEDSRKNSRDLRNTLEKSKNELDELRAELEALRTASTALLNTQDESRTDLTALQTALTKAGNSLASLEQSFAAYRMQAELQIGRLEKTNRFWKWGCAALGVTAAGLTAWTFIRSP
jgi:septal ring factor EnvC (AmiA/AmiB activator)